MAHYTNGTTRDTKAGNNFCTASRLFVVSGYLGNLPSFTLRPPPYSQSENVAQRLAVPGAHVVVDEEVEGRVRCPEKHHEVMRNVGEVVVAASEVELWLHERSDMNHDRRGQAYYEQNRGRHQRFRQSDFFDGPRPGATY